MPIIIEVAAAGIDGAARRAGEALRNGRLAVIPTDTVYGLAAHPAIPGAARRLAAAKTRDRDKPVVLLAADMDSVRACGARLDEAEEALAARFWPGPLTLILRVGEPGKDAVTEGFRIPDSDVALAVLRDSGGLLRVTSANVSGETPALTAAQAVDALGPRVDVVLDAGRAPGGTPSTVVQVVNGTPNVLRDGAIPAEHLRSALAERASTPGRLT